jgi:trehalose 6-phosphate phosphatase
MYDARRGQDRRLPHLLRGEGRAALGALAAGRALLAFDFDGTLAPLVDRHDRARLGARTRRLLATVARLYPCAVISGRARHDVARRLGRISLLALAGSHGAEMDDRAQRMPRSSVRSWSLRLRRHLRGLPGVGVEVKPHGVAVHYRRAEDKGAAELAILSIVTTLEDARLLHGSNVVEVVPIASPTKGDALAALRVRFEPRVTLYVGDDVTDEDAFRSRGPGGLLPVRVGRPRPTAALFRLDEQPEVDSLLFALIELARPDDRPPVHTDECREGATHEQPGD